MFCNLLFLKNISIIIKIRLNYFLFCFIIESSQNTNQKKTNDQNNGCEHQGWCR